jgi:NtrC-family two-component system sensor histidine kinase KinB
MKWTLRKKIIIGYGIAIFLILVVLSWAIYHLLHLGQASAAILKENYKSILAAENMIDAIERQDSGTLLILLGFQPEDLGQFRQNEAKFLQWLGRAKDNITVKGEEKIVDEIDKGYSSYLVNFSKLHLLGSTDRENAVSFYQKTLLPSFTSVRDACISLKEINETTMVKASSNAKGVADRAIWSMIVVGLAAIGLGFGFSLMLSNLLTRPLRHIMEGAKKIAEGNYDVEIQDQSSDELGQLGGEFNAMVRKLKSYHDLNIGKLLTEKRKSEAIINSIDDGIIVVDADFKVVDINPAAARAIGAELEQAKEKHFLEVVKNEKLFQLIKQSAESGRSPRVEEDKDIIIIEKEKTQSHYQYWISPIYSEAKTMIGVVLLLRDITRLKELDRLKSEFVMMASHELRTPLTSIGMGIDLLLEKGVEKLSQEEQKLLQAAHEDIQRLKSLVNDLLTLSKIESGKIDMEFEPVSISVLFDKVVLEMKIQAENKSIELSYEAPENLLKIKADAHKIAWVLTNLVANALKFTEAGGYIRLSAEQLGSLAYISVKDNGAGIPIEYQSKIFDKFVHVENQEEHYGSGLGLAICREIVHAHGGTIWVDSAPGEGSTFTFTIPLET